MLITRDNVVQILMYDNTILMSYVYSYKSSKYWKLIESVDIKLSNGDIITIPKGFTWDLSSAPRFLWGLFPPFGDFLLAALIHDYLYVNKLYNQKFCDKEMLIWSNIINDNKFDNYCRYAYVRLFGWLLWRGIIKFKK